MTRIYAFVNQKGGVGKTTSAVNISAFLAESGRQVLLVDLDPQANATSGAGINKRELERSSYDLLLNEATVDEVLIRREEWGFDMVPAQPLLAGAEVELVNIIAREYRLKTALEKVDGRYDYILIDSPPSLGLLTVNALTAARDGVLIPVQCEYLALEGLSQLSETLQLVNKYLNPQLRIRGLIMTMYDARTNLSRQVVEETRRYFPGQVFRSIIPRNVRLSEAPSFGQPINAFAPDSPGAMAYKVLTAELLREDRDRDRDRVS